MKIAISDYDGTLCLDGQVSIEDLGAIKKWRQAGHRFGLASGRDFNMTYHAINNWHIDVDFLICTSGATVFDSNMRMLYREDIDDSLVPVFISDPVVSGSLHFIFCRWRETFLYEQNHPSWFRDLNIPYKSVTFQDSLKLRAVQQINLSYDNTSDAAEAAAGIKKNYDGILTPHINGRHVDVTAVGVSKAKAILKMLGVFNWSRDNVLVIGDGENDLSMIKMFRGATVAWAEEEIKNEAVSIYDSVGHFLLDNL